MIPAKTVTAAVAVAPLETELQQLPLPEVGADDGLLAVEACGLCGTDWDFYTRRRGAQLGPLILGHEVVGRIHAVSERAAQRWGVRSAPVGPAAASHRAIAWPSVVLGISVGSAKSYHPP